MAVKLLSSSLVAWRWQNGTEFDDRLSGVATGIDGTSVVIGGYTYGSWVEDSVGDEEDLDMIGLSLDTDSNLLWTYQAGTSESEACFDVAVRPTDGATLLAGYSRGTWDGTANYYAQFAGVLLETGAEEATVAQPTLSTPSPTLSPSPSPSLTAPTTGAPSSGSTCGETESFRIVSSVLPAIQGCFQMTSESFAAGGELDCYTKDGFCSLEQILVFGWDNESQVGVPYDVQYVSETDAQDYVYCVTEDDAVDSHPADAVWSCDIDLSGDLVLVTEAEVSFQCGCAGTPAPAAPTLAPAPFASVPPETVPPEAPVEASSSASSSSFPLAAVICGTLGGLALVSIVGIFVVKQRHNRDQSFGSSPAAPDSGPSRISSGAVASAGAGAAAGGKLGGDSVGSSAPPPPEYSEPPPPAVDPALVNTPPPPYSEPASYYVRR
ncbi:unnamed protein product [Hapterophycus canaliculatus]